MRVAFFGGSFDPPHVGHVLAASYVLSTAPIDRVLFAPVSGHAFQKPLSPFADRLAMTRLATQTLNGVEVSPIESELPDPNYTLYTLQELERRHPDWQLRLMVGSDVFAERKKWQHFEQVVAMAPPLILARAGFAGDDGEVGVLPEVSSSAVRALLRERSNDARLSALVPRQVLAYIEQHQLYRPAP